MELVGVVQPAKNGCVGFDTDCVVTAETAAAFAAQGYLFCVRYLSREDCIEPGDLTGAEANDILSGGLALMAVQHVCAQGWQPSAGLGQQYGTNAADHATTIGFPAGVTLWCDLEGVAQGVPASQVNDYCRAWYTAVASAGYLPGLYVGADCILNGTELYDLPYQHYWQSLSRVPQLPARGYQMVQTGVAEPVYGIGIDHDTVLADDEGGLPVWLAPRP